MAGCKSYPVGISADEWHALSPERQADLTEIQELLDQYEYDARICRQESEIRVETQVPLSVVGKSEKLNLKMGRDRKAYDACMLRLGWTEEKKQPIVNWIETQQP